MGVGQKPAFFVTHLPAGAETKRRPTLMHTQQPIEAKIASLIAPDLGTMGYDLVRVQLTGGGRYATLQVMAERADQRAMTVDDCVRISHAVSAQLDTDDSFNDRYTLEVSSPGIDRPLVRLKDFERFKGHLARIDLATSIGALGEKQKRFQGSIVRVTGKDADAAVEFRTEHGEVRIPVQSIAKAKLIMTAALIGEDKPKEERG